MGQEKQNRQTLEKPEASPPWEEGQVSLEPKRRPIRSLARYWSIGVTLLSVIVAIGWTILQLTLPADGYSGVFRERLGIPGFVVDTDLVAHRSAARATGEAGLQIGDFIIATGGHTIEERLRTTLSGQPLPNQEWQVGATIPYTILKAGQQQTIPVRLINLPPEEVLRAGRTTYLLVFVILALTIFMVIQKPEEHATHLLLLCTSSTAILQTHEVLDVQTSLIAQPIIFWADRLLEHLTCWFCYAPLAHAFWVFPEKKKIIQRYPILVWLAYLIYPVFTLAGAFLGGPTMVGRLMLSERVSMFAMVVLFVILAVGIGHSFVAARTPKARSQIRWIAWGFATGMAPLVFLDLLPLSLFGRPILSQEIALIPVFIAPISLAIAIIRHNLFDIELIINRSLVYGTLTAFLGVLYLLLVRLLTLVVQAVTPAGNETFVVFIATLTIALAFAPLRQQVQALIDRAFYRTKLNYQRLLPEMSAKLSTNIVLERLTPLLTQELPRRLQTAGTSLLVLDPEGRTLTFSGDTDSAGLPVDHPLAVYLRQSRQPLLYSSTEQHLPKEAAAFLQEHGVELSIPLIVGNQLVGLYNLGAKLSGVPYTRDEVQLLTILGQQAAVSVENARLYREIENHSLTLEGQVKQRTTELASAVQEAQQELAERKRAEDRLQRYSAELAQSNEELKQFTYIISHDLRAPLVNLKGFAAELYSALDVIRPALDTFLPQMDEKQRSVVTSALQEDVPGALGFIDASVTRMDHFINALLKLSRWGRSELSLVTVNMETLVHETLDTLAHHIEQRQVQVTVGPLPEVVADRTSMEQIMSNILNNAVLYLESGRPGKIEIIGVRSDGETTFHVRDNGRGIAQEDMGKVFAPFRRAGKQDVPGEGMGLAYVQTLVRRHGGRIWCESELGVGTTFTFTISNDLKGSNRA